jgi:hypothetical protein
MTIEVLTYATSPLPTLPLFRTASALDIPLRVIGETTGVLPFRKFYKKIDAYLDALHTSNASHVFVVDAYDSMFVRRPHVPAHLVDTIVVSAECGSYPMCYTQLLDTLEPVRACVRSGSPQCFLNSGNVMGPRTRLIRWYDSLRRLRPTLPRRERWSDQATMTRLWLAGTTDLQLDHRHEVFFNLYECHGTTPRYLGTRELCFRRAYNPILDIRIHNGSFTVGDNATPCLVHASGNGAAKLRRLQTSLLAERTNRAHS